MSASERDCYSAGRRGRVDIAVFSDALKQHRNRLNLTQAEMAASLQIPARTYCEWENGKTETAVITQEGALSRLERAKADKRRPQKSAPSVGEARCA